MSMLAVAAETSHAHSAASPCVRAMLSKSGKSGIRNCRRRTSSQIKSPPRIRVAEVSRPACRSAKASAIAPAAAATAQPTRCSMVREAGALAVEGEDARMSIAVGVGYTGALAKWGTSEEMTLIEARGGELGARRTNVRGRQLACGGRSSRSDANLCHPQRVELERQQRIWSPAT